MTHPHKELECGGQELVRITNPRRIINVDGEKIELKKEAHNGNVHVRLVRERHPIYRWKWRWRHADTWDITDSKVTPTIFATGEFPEEIIRC